MGIYAHAAPIDAGVYSRTGARVTLFASNPGGRSDFLLDSDITPKGGLPTVKRQDPKSNMEDQQGDVSDSQPMMVIESCPSWDCSVPGQLCNSFQPSPLLDMVCTNSCQDGTYSNDGTCDDGGEGSEYDDCFIGTDCADCGSRAPRWICCAEANANCQVNYLLHAPSCASYARLHLLTHLLHAGYMLL